ncbi:MAG: GNAT family N-acetyltransferase [Polyangiaceae bacterium]|nr:GNAT family N-acetyltransferase [Polyangiaceae bacterium]
MTDTPFLQGERLTLRVLDRAAFIDKNPAWTSDREVVRHLSRGTWPVTRDDAAREHDARLGARGDIELGVHDRDGGGFVGVTGLHSHNTVARSCEFRILIGERAAWNKGLGTEACQLMTAYAFELLNMNRVWLGVNADNEGARRSYVKSGFVEEGRLREEVYRNGAYHDVVRMSVLRREYEALRTGWALWPWIERQFPR